MTVRRVVTGHTAEGKAIFASDTQVEGLTAAIFPGVEFHRLWGADEIPTFPDDGALRPNPSFFPPAGGFRFYLFTVPPASMISPAPINMDKAIQEFEEKFPGALSVFTETEDPAMHTTNTIDFEYILSGEVWLELDDGVEAHLHPGDTVVQNGTRHAWRNKGSEPCCMVFCMVGAYRQDESTARALP